MPPAYTTNALLFGYDPGGDGKHGLCAARLEEKKIRQLELCSLKTGEEVLNCIQKYCSKHSEELPVILAVDTLTCWSLGKGGQRHADELLRNKYDHVAKSVIPQNSLYSAMTVNGMAVILKLQEECKGLDLIICETHPKVLHHALTGKKYDFQGNRDCMTCCLKKQFEAAWEKEDLESLHNINNIKNDHEFDAALSLLAAWKYAIGEWTTNLHQGAADDDRHVFPCGNTCFPWPENLDNCS